MTEDDSSILATVCPRSALPDDSARAGARALVRGIAFGLAAGAIAAGAAGAYGYTTEDMDIMDISLLRDTDSLVRNPVCLLRRAELALQHWHRQYCKNHKSPSLPPGFF